MGNDLCQMGFAAGPLTRYGAVGGRASRAASLPPSYTTTWDTTGTRPGKMVKSGEI
jgi:hypothetical protein